MAKKSFFRRIGEFLRIVKPKPVHIPPKPTYPPKPSRPPFTVKSADADERAARQKTLRARRRQLELKNRRTEYTAIKTDRSLRPSERAKRYQNYIRRYGQKNHPHPDDETREFWRAFREAGGS